MKHIIAASRRQAELAAEQLGLARGEFRTITDPKMLHGLLPEHLIIVEPFDGLRYCEFMELVHIIRAKKPDVNIQRVTT